MQNKITKLSPAAADTMWRTHSGSCRAPLQPGILELPVAVHLASIPRCLRGGDRVVLSASFSPHLKPALFRPQARHPACSTHDPSMNLLLTKNRLNPLSRFALPGLVAIAPCWTTRRAPARAWRNQAHGADVRGKSASAVWGLLRGAVFGSLGWLGAGDLRRLYKTLFNMPPSDFSPESLDTSSELSFGDQ